MYLKETDMSRRLGSIQDFYEWVKARDPSETYNYFLSRDCAVARYARERGLNYRPEEHPGYLGDHIDVALESASLQIQGNHYDRERGAYARDPSKLTMGTLRKEIE